MTSFPRSTAAKTSMIGIAGLLALSACSSTSSSEDSSAIQNTTPTSISVVAQPDNKGQVILDAITGAKSTVDIPIYTIGGDQIVDALKTAKQNGVKIRIQLNGGYGLYVPGAQELLADLQQAPGSGTIEMKWSNSNFNITHQKSVIVDAADASGNAIPVNQLPDTALLVISTGNFSSFKDEAFYNKRDYDISVSDKDLINSAASVFASDFSCPTPTTVDPSGLKADDTLVWSNGSTFPQADGTQAYPAFGSYFPFNYKTATDQGNSNDAYLRIIKSAKSGDVLRFVNEELSDVEIIGALTDAASQGVDVRINMTLPEKFDPTDPKQARAWSGVAQIVKAGGTAHMFTNNLDDSSALYIHSKFVALNDTEMYVGSANASSGSLLMNRELGINLDSGEQQALNQILSVFDQDWARTDSWVTVWTKDNVPTPPVTLQLPAGDLLTLDQVGPGVIAPELTSSQPQPCGPVQPASS